MSNSYRIRTQIGVDKQINLQLDQDFDQLEILSLKIRQQDVYPRFCADYGVVTGRVIVNDGYGVPNVKISIFIPLDEIDQNNQIISNLYPYRNITDLNDDGYRYNLLPYQKQHGGHTPTGTFPSKQDIVTNPALVEIYDKYYKFSVKTNGSGDFMITGVPLGEWQLVMDCDLSDIGPFSVSPQDLVDIGLATPDQVDGNKFPSSTNLIQLPQIINQIQTIQVQPFWGDPTECQISITRQDFNLQDSGVRITPSALFMGSLFTNVDEQYISRRCRPTKGIGNLCNLISGIGEIIAVRQTIFNDEFGYPILEQATLPGGGKVIDEDGTFLLNVPMNMNYVTTNEFGEQIISLDPTVGIPTTGKYRFKIKYDQPSTFLKKEIRRGYFLIPNVKEYGWQDSNIDPAYQKLNSPQNIKNYKMYQSSYYFGLDWSGYTNGFEQNELVNRVSEIINCRDTFYEMRFNKVYTTAQLIDNFKSGGFLRFVAIKDITDNTCESEINKFPATDANYKFDFIYFIVNFLISNFSLLLLVLIPVVHVLSLLLTLVRELLILVIVPISRLVYRVCTFLNKWGFRLKCKKPVSARDIRNRFPTLKKIRIPILTYPDCEACDCSGEDLEGSGSFIDQSCNSDLSFSSNWSAPPLFDNAPRGREFIELDRIQYMWSGWAWDDVEERGRPFQQRIPLAIKEDTVTNDWMYYVNCLPPWEVINQFSLKGNYFNSVGYGISRIGVSFFSDLNQGRSHYDNAIALLVDEECFSSLSGQTLLSFQNPNLSKDINAANTISGFTLTNGTIEVKYGDPLQMTGQPLTTNYILGSGGSPTYTSSTYNFNTDLEYFQVITGITYSQFYNQNVNRQNVDSLGKRLTKGFTLYFDPEGRQLGAPFFDNTLNNYLNYYKGTNLGTDQPLYIVFLVRGVDPLSGKHKVKYDISRLFGYDTEDEVVVEGNYYLNIPIQPGGRCVRHDQLTTNDELQNDYTSEGPKIKIFFESYLFFPGNNWTSYETDLHLYYSSLDTDQLGKFSPPGLNRQEFPRLLVRDEFFTLNDFDDAVGIGASMRLTTRNNGITNAYIQTGEYIEGGSYIRYIDPPDFDGKVQPYAYFGPSYINGSYSISPPPNSRPSLRMTNPLNLVMRTDRLPTGTDLDTLGSNTFSFQCSTSLGYYFIDESGNTNIILGDLIPDQDDGESTDDVVTGNTTQQILESLTCPGLRDLDCYELNGGQVTVLPKENDCNTNTPKNLPVVVDGCYSLVNEPFFSLFGRNNDFSILNEWKTRFRSTFALCRGLVAQSFNNSWINGSLFAFPFSSNIFFDSQNRPFVRKELNSITKLGQDVEYTFCGVQLVYEEKSSNFYYRSSPFSLNQGFIGSQYTFFNKQFNTKYLKYPTTMVDLGPQYSWTKDVYYSDEYFGYIMDELDPTSYTPTENLNSIFALSRIVNAKIFFSVGIAKSLFSRPRRRVDGDYAQMVQINSQYGINPFNSENYEEATGSTSPIYIAVVPNTGQIFGTQNTIFGIFYSGNTSDRDLISPKRIDFSFTGSIADFRGNILPTTNQNVPFYFWRNFGYDASANYSFPSSIFGNEKNNWVTDKPIFSAYEYQRLDRFYFPSFVGGNQQVQNSFGYVYQTDQNGSNQPSILPGTSNYETVTSGPYYFYFGIKVGATAIDKFRQKYIPSE